MAVYAEALSRGSQPDRGNPNHSGGKPQLRFLGSAAILLGIPGIPRVDLNTRERILPQTPSPSATQEGANHAATAVTVFEENPGR